MLWTCFFASNNYADFQFIAMHKLTYADPTYIRANHIQYSSAHLAYLMKQSPHRNA